MTCDRRIAVQHSADPVRPLHWRSRRSPAGRLGLVCDPALLERDPRLEGAAVDEVIFSPADNRETYAALELTEPDRALSITPSLNSLLASNDGLEPAEDLRYELESGPYATGLRAGAH